MTLYELLRVTRFDQMFSVYVTNTYDQNIHVGSGVRRDLLDEDETEAFDHLMNKVDMLRLAKDGETLVVFVRDENYDKRAEELYSEDYAEKWDYRNPTTRPWRHFVETEVMK